MASTTIRKNLERHKGMSELSATAHVLPLACVIVVEIRLKWFLPIDSRICFFSVHQELINRSGEVSHGRVSSTRAGSRSTCYSMAVGQNLEFRSPCKVDHVW